MAIQQLFLGTKAGAVDRASGGTITYAGGKTIHTFHAPGTFNNYNPDGTLSVRYLVVGGGGVGVAIRL